jgi:hypothetical protein
MTPFARFLGASLLVGLAALLAAPTGANDKPAPAQQVKAIDVAICLDVSGSMQGLIQSAKNKLWDIVNELARIKPAPTLRVALYSYGHNTYDRNAGWVKKDLDLTADLDLLYEKLFALTINGGNEYVTRVCRDAVRDLKWSEDKNALKLIFVCGNEPAGQDPLVKLKEAADFAIAKGIVVNPIYCGNADDGDARDWREYAGLCGGRFASIDHNRSHVVLTTPQDKQLAELGVKLNETYVAYGKEGKAKADNQKTQTANAFESGAGVAASRVAAQNSTLYRCADWDLVDRLKEDPKFDITKIPEAELSATLRKLKPAERVTYVKEMAAKRGSIQKQITELQNQRQKYIADEMKRNPNAGDRAFDAAIREAVRTQAAAKGLLIPKE